MHRRTEYANGVRESSMHTAPRGRNDESRFRRSLMGLTQSRLCVAIGACAALLWLLVRSGARPNRLTYPCQQAAAGAATSGLLLPMLGVLSPLRKRLRGAFVASPLCAFSAVFAAILIVLTPGAPGFERGGDGTPPAPVHPRDSYEADVFVLDNAHGPNGQNFEGLDDLIRWMGANGTPFFLSNASPSYICGPTGLIGPDDIVVIKINYQWNQRGGTNIDLLRGLIRRILDHPDTFGGEIVICENAQFASVSSFDRLENNAEDPTLSPRDTVDQFAQQGYSVSLFDWTAIRNTAVEEFSADDLNDGYVIHAIDAELGGRVSYPKFSTAHGTHISLRYGVWDPSSGRYDRERLKFINVPVLKSHHAVYGATACVKNYMGVVTTAQNTNSHLATANGILGALLAEIRMADLNILDCIWINANPGSGPATSYAGATRVNKIVAGLDPVAIDVWATGNILIPTFLANGYAPPWPIPSADPDDPASAFREYLDNSMYRILASGQDVTNDVNRIHALRWSGDTRPSGDINADGLVDGRDIGEFVSATLRGDADPTSIMRSDLNDDGNLDAGDSTLLATDLLRG